MPPLFSPFLTTTETATAYLPPDAGRLKTKRSGPQRYWRAKGSSRSFQHSTQQDRTVQVSRRRLKSGNLSATNRGNSVLEERLSPATLRRLSWRRRGAGRAHGSPRSGRLRLAQVVEMRRRLAPRASNFVGLGKSQLNGTFNRLDKSNDHINFLKTTIITKLDDWLNELNADEEDLKLRRSLKFRWSSANNLRGRYGETLIHILIVNQTNEHLILLVLLLHLFPLLVYDLIESNKFKGLSCLHLAIASSNEQLVDYLLAECVLIEREFDLKKRPLLLLAQRVTGTLFRSPIAGSNKPKSTNNNYPLLLSNKMAEQSWPGKLSSCLLRNRHRRRLNKVSSGDDKAGNDHLVYWCDLMDHWPTANGHTHLILFDRILAGNWGPIAPEQVNKLPLKAGEQSRADQKHSKVDQATDSSFPIYLGDTPLAWSVSFKRRSIYESLVSMGANQDAQDNEGNSCLHQLVINNQTGWTRFLVKSGANSRIKNNNELTPMHLACHLGRCELFSEFLELSAVEFWSYSMTSCCGYPLTSLDSISTDQDESSAMSNKQQMSAMSVILESNKSNNEQKSKLLSSPVVKKLLEEKWRIYARRLFYNELSFLLIQLILLTLAISLRPVASSKPINNALIVSGSLPLQFNESFRETFARLWLDRQRWVSIQHDDCVGKAVSNNLLVARTEHLAPFTARRRRQISHSRLWACIY